MFRSQAWARGASMGMEETNQCHLNGTQGWRCDLLQKNEQSFFKTLEIL